MQRIKIATLIALCASGLVAQSLVPAPGTANQVLATLTVKNGIAREQLTPVMPGEVRATVQLYLDGRIQQWYSRADGKGVVFVLNCTSVDEAKSVLEGLPLIKANLASFEYMALAPLKPLGLLIAPPAK